MPSAYMMDGWVEGWMQEWMDEWVEGWRDGWLNGWRDGQIPGEKKQVSLFYALVFMTTSIKINLNTAS